jgi:hypothetical protein
MDDHHFGGNKNSSRKDRIELSAQSFLNDEHYA